MKKQIYLGIASGLYENINFGSFIERAGGFVIGTEMSSGGTLFQALHLGFVTINYNSWKSLGNICSRVVLVGYEESIIGAQETINNQGITDETCLIKEVYFGPALGLYENVNFANYVQRFGAEFVDMNIGSEDTLLRVWNFNGVTIAHNSWKSQNGFGSRIRLFGSELSDMEKNIRDEQDFYYINNVFSGSRSISIDQ